MEVLAKNIFVPWESGNADQHFERLYLSLRQKERRIYTDEQLKQLPNIAQTHPFYEEWTIRKQSSDRLIYYLKKKKKALKILEIGCGNGWLAAKLAEMENVSVTGIDRNEAEINQGARVFKKDNLQFKRGCFEAGIFNGQKFDIILFAAAIQYFHSLKEILSQVGQYLVKGGEIHVLDTNFYDSSNISSAIDRTKAHFHQMGFPELAASYFHHQLNDLSDFDYKILYHPKSILNRIFVKNPFYWICIKPNK